MRWPVLGYGQELPPRGHDRVAAIHRLRPPAEHLEQLVRELHLTKHLRRSVLLSLCHLRERDLERRAQMLREHDVRIGRIERLRPRIVDLLDRAKQRLGYHVLIEARLQDRVVRHRVERRGDVPLAYGHKPDDAP